MRTNRKNVLIGLGLIIAIGGAVVGSGAFSTVEADRGVSVETAGDADAYLAITPGDDYKGSAYISNDSDGSLTFDLGQNGTTDFGGSGFNENATTTLNQLVEIQNQGESTVDISVSNESDTLAGDSTTITLDGAKVTFNVNDHEPLSGSDSTNIDVIVDTDDSYTADGNTDVTIHAEESS
ncbi:hypothetical protein ACFOZ7_19820 [Natribaculum luteum]|uniref:DUF1102 domain-containing protein n=1 Tax=Natribaculum luteum TaxID=1586232 RepID=A0ABD5P4G6_9EURY|nr:hypothetical protein [Natribaculum luteum]